MSEQTLVERLRDLPQIRRERNLDFCLEAAARIEALERMCRAVEANPYDEQEYLDAAEAAMGSPQEPGKWCGPGSPSAARIAELEAIVEKLPDKVADRLFVSEGPHAEVIRLVMETHYQKLDGPGWCKSAVADQVRDAITTIAQAAKEEVGT